MTDTGFSGSAEVTARQGEPEPADTEHTEAAPVERARTEIEQTEAEPTSEAEQAEAARLESAGIEAAQIEPAEVEAVQTETAQTEAVQLEAAQIEAVQPEAVQVDAVQLEAARLEKAGRRSRVRRNVLRWTGAVILTVAVAGGITYAISLPQRTDIPGLATASDGRYDFPHLILPTLPAGQPAPTASANYTALQHLADIRKLLLPRPTGAKTTDAKATGWFTDAYKLFSSSATKSKFAEYGLRHTATTTWTTSDGATTQIYLLQFADGSAAANAAQDLSVNVGDQVSLSGGLAGVPNDTAAKSVNPTGSATGDYSVVTAAGKTTRYGAFDSGDVVALVIESGPASVPLAPFVQTLTLQAEMLG